MDRAAQRLRVGQSGSADNALDDLLRQVKPLVIRNCNSTGLARVLELYMRTGLLMNHETAFLRRTNDYARLQAGELGRHSALDGDF